MRPVVLAYPRAAGTLLVLIGIGLLYFRLVLPLLNAERGVGPIVTSVTSTLVGVIGLIVGLIYLILGSAGVMIAWPEPHEPRVRRWALPVILGTIGLAIHFLATEYIKSLGYTF